MGVHVAVCIDATTDELRSLMRTLLAGDDDVRALIRETISECSAVRTKLGAAYGVSCGMPEVAQARLLCTPAHMSTQTPTSMPMHVSMLMPRRLAR